MMKKTFAAAVAALCVLGASAEAKTSTHGVRVGVLRCETGARVGLIITSSTRLNCQFSRTDGRGVQKYTGSIRRYGPEVGITGTGVMSYVAYAPGNIPLGGLAGSYSGMSVSATVGVGVGMHVLAGKHNDITLQPLSMHGLTGISAGAGTATMSLDYVGRAGKAVAGKKYASKKKRSVRKSGAAKRRADARRSGKKRQDMRHYSPGTTKTKSPATN